jgi:hypothetical protein
MPGSEYIFATVHYKKKKNMKSVLGVGGALAADVTLLAALVARARRTRLAAVAAQVTHLSAVVASTGSVRAQGGGAGSGAVAAHVTRLAAVVARTAAGDALLAGLRAVLAQMAGLAAVVARTSGHCRDAMNLQFVLAPSEATTEEIDCPTLHSRPQPSKSA